MESILYSVVFSYLKMKVNSIQLLNNSDNANFFSEIKEEGIYRKNGVSHKINAFIEKNFVNIQASLYNISNDNLITETNVSSDNHSNSSSSLIHSVLKSANLLSHSSSYSTLSFNISHHSNENSHNSLENKSVVNNSKSILGANGSESEDTCTITSALKHYLIHLKEPLMTFQFNQQFLAACRKELFIDRITEIYKLLHMLPPFHFEAIELLIRHLQKYN